jgi:hypothetical protein
VTSITPAPTAPDGSHGWYKRSVHVLVAADGLGVPVSATRCVLDPTGPVGAFDALPAGCPLAGAGGDVINDGTHTISAASANVAGEKEAPVSLTLKIDRTPPTVTCSPGAEFVTGGGGEVVVARVKDATSGPLSSVVYAPASVRTIGAKQARLTGYDNAGNATTVSCPYRVLGHLTSWMDWTFDHYSRYTTVTQLDAERVPIGAVIRLACRGRGCPFVARSIRVAKRSCRGKRCATSSTSGSSTSRTVDLARLLAHRHLAPRTRLVVSITKTNLFGAMWTFTIRPARDPSNTKACLVPGSFAEVFAGC